ncbi:adenosylcobinamide-GDP ribazoletransferase [Litoreibacter roseus]|uniref:adenosylcobinamide-GDP ribazoletransferase n=1 Tax=Litoreibacter roseus TaxID=2601869 RepID=UPI003570AC2C
MTAKNDIFSARWNELLMAFSLLTRLPLPQPDWEGDKPAARAVWAYPIAGASVALLAALVGAFALIIGLSAPLAAICVLFVGIMTTGAMHEDGLADCADGFWGGWDTARRLEIMKDSRIGAYGVIALGLSLLGRWAALSEILAADGYIFAICAAAIVSRGAMVGVMVLLPPARQDGLSHTTGRPEIDTTVVAIGLATAFALFAGFGAVLFAGLATAGCFYLARAKIGGQTGDVLGATQQIVELAVLVSIASSLSS